MPCLLNRQLSINNKAKTRDRNLSRMSIKQSGDNTFAFFTEDIFIWHKAVLKNKLTPAEQISVKVRPNSPILIIVRK
jgi:hypothetical protein